MRERFSVNISRGQEAATIGAAREWLKEMPMAPYW